MELVVRPASHCRARRLASDNDGVRVRDRKKREGRERLRPVFAADDGENSASERNWMKLERSLHLQYGAKELLDQIYSQQPFVGTQPEDRNE